MCVIERQIWQQSSNLAVCRGLMRIDVSCIHNLGSMSTESIRGEMRGKHPNRTGIETEQERNPMPSITPLITDCGWVDGDGGDGGKDQMAGG